MLFNEAKTVTGELWEPGKRAGWGRGGATGGLGAGMRSGAVGRLVAGGRAASGDGHARELGRQVRGLGKHWDTGDGEIRWDTECFDEMSCAEQATGKHTDYIPIYKGGVRAKASGTHTRLLSRANPQCPHTTHPALVPNITGHQQGRASLGVTRPREPRMSGSESGP